MIRFIKIDLDTRITVGSSNGRYYKSITAKNIRLALYKRMD